MVPLAQIMLLISRKERMKENTLICCQRKSVSWRRKRELISWGVWEEELNKNSFTWEERLPLCNGTMSTDLSISAKTELFERKYSLTELMAVRISGIGRNVNGREE